MFTWLRDPRFAPNEAAVEELAGFLPVEAIEERKDVCHDISTASVTEGRIELELAGSNRLRVVGSYDPEALARLIRGLSA